jgi:hypothetical protein
MNKQEIQSAAINALTLFNFQFNVFDQEDKWFCLIGYGSEYYTGQMRFIIDDALTHNGSLMLSLQVESCIFMPKAQRSHVSELIVRINDNLDYGRFVLNEEDGRFYHESALAGETDDIYSTENIISMIYTGMKMFEKHFLGLMSVGYGQVHPANAYADILALHKSDLN